MLKTIRGLLFIVDSVFDAVRCKVIHNINSGNSNGGNNSGLFWIHHIKTCFSELSDTLKSAYTSIFYFPH